MHDLYNHEKDHLFDRLRLGCPKNIQKTQKDEKKYSATSDIGTFQKGVKWPIREENLGDRKEDISEEVKLQETNEVEEEEEEEEVEKEIKWLQAEWEYLVEILKKTDSELDWDNTL